MLFPIQNLLIVHNISNIALFKHTTPLRKVGVCIPIMQIKLQG